MKWIAVAGGVLLIGLLLLWREVRSGDGSAAEVASKRPPRPAEGGDAPVLPPAPRAEPGDAPARAARPAGTLAPGDQEGQVKKYSEEFWERIDEVYSRRLLELAAPCYTGGEHRKAKLKIAYRYDITDGAVAVKDAHVVESTLTDKKLEQCMMREVAKAAFKDPRMPDWASSADEEETLVIRIELLKRFGPETD